MKINFYTKNITLNEPIKIFVEEKINSLEKFFKENEVAEARVEIGKPSKHHKTGPIFRAEVNLTAGSFFFRAESEHIDLRSAIIKVKEELENQISRLKSKKRDILRKKEE